MSVLLQPFLPYFVLYLKVSSSRFIWLLLILAFGREMSGQVNLVRNPSFEARTGCPLGLSWLGDLNDWDRPVGHMGSSDYFHPCAGPGALNGVPTNMYGTRAPKTGQAYVGLYAYYSGGLPDYREYVQSKLKEPLVAGRQYTLSMSFSLAGGTAVDRLGMCLTNGPLSRTHPTSAVSYINASPQLETPAGVPQNNATGWTTITILYTAVGGEDYVTIGNFYEGDSTQVFAGPTPNGRNNGFYYIEDIEVLDWSKDLGPDITICEGDSAQLMGFTGNYSEWRLAGKNGVIGNQMNLVVSPIQTQTYVYTTGVHTDTITVHVIPTKHGYDTVQVCENDSLLFESQYLLPNTHVEKTFTAVSGCDSVVQYFGQPIAFPVINLGGEIVGCENKELELAMPALEGEWTGTWWNGGNQQNALVDEPGTYWIEVSHPSCEKQHDSVIVSFKDCSLHLYVPNAFTPNDDIHNATFKAEYSGVLKSFSMSIFNRWGEQIFVSNNIEEGWDGTFRSNLVQGGTFVWKASYQGEYGPMQYQIGKVTVLK